MDWRSSIHRGRLSKEAGSTEAGRPDAVSAVSRRRAFGRMAGIAVAGAAGGVVLDDLTSSRALAATIVDSGAVAPAVVMLTDGATISMDASQGNDFRVTIAGNRTIANPANPTDGQRIVVQVTQGGQGANTLAFGSAFEFGAGLAQPTLSTTAGYTDLLGFIYNAAKGSWLFVAYALGFSTPAGTPTPTPTPTPTATATATTTPTPTPTPTTSTTTSGGGPYRLFPAINGQASPINYGGPFLAGVVFKVSTAGGWFDGYWWWVAASGQSTGPQKFALWQPYNLNNGALIPGSTVTSGQLAAGQWNYIPLPAPLALSPGVPYIAATGFTGPFPDGNNQYNSAGPYSAASPPVRCSPTRTRAEPREPRSACPSRSSAPSAATQP